MSDEPITAAEARNVAAFDDAAWLASCPWHPPVSRNAVILALALHWSHASGRSARYFSRHFFRDASYMVPLEAARELNGAGFGVRNHYRGNFARGGGSRRTIELYPRQRYS